jgi:hypothetical protein
MATIIGNEYSGNSATATFADTAGSSLSEITPYVVGLSLDEAPYTSIQDAIDAAAAVATATDMKTVYIQPGTYTESFTLKDHVNVFGLPIGFRTTSGSDSHSVLVTGTVTIDNALASCTTALSGVAVNGDVIGAALLIAGTQTVNLDISCCYLVSASDSAVDCSCVAANINFACSSVNAAATYAPLNITDCAGIFFDASSSINSDDNTPSLISSSVGAQFFYLGAYCFAPLHFDGNINGILLGQIGFANAQPFVNILSASATVNLQMQAVNVFGGTYAIDGVVGATLNIGGTAFPGVTLINPLLTRNAFSYMFGPISYDYGASFLTVDTDGANRSLTIAGDSAIDQDVTTSGNPEFNTIALKYDPTFKMTMSIADSAMADHTLLWTFGDADRSIYMQGNLIFANNFSTAGNFALTLTTTAITNATLPEGTTTLVPTTGTGASGTWNISISGNAATASAVAASAITGTTLASNVVTSSLTVIGTLTNLTVTNTITGSISGNAATATALQTARNINGTSFNGTADITVTAAAGTLTGTTLNGTVVTSSLSQLGANVGIGKAAGTASLDILATNSSLTPVYLNIQPASGNGQLQFKSNTSTGFMPTFLGTGDDSNDVGLTLIGQSTPGNDTGTVPVFRIDGRQNDGTALDTRPIFQITNLLSNRLQLSQAGELTLPLQPAFSANKSANTNNVTGDGTTYTLICNTEIYDQGANYNTTTGVFTAPVTGRYSFCLGCGIFGLLNTHTQGYMELVTSNRTYRTPELSPYAAANSSASFGFGTSIQADMDLGDTASITVTVANGTLVVDVDGGGAPIRTYFQGRLAC